MSSHFVAPNALTASSSAMLPRVVLIWEHHLGSANSNELIRLPASSHSLGGGEGGGIVGGDGGDGGSNAQMQCLSRLSLQLAVELIFVL